MDRSVFPILFDGHPTVSHFTSVHPNEENEVANEFLNLM
jgi:hypothetical protein